MNTRGFHAVSIPRAAYGYLSDQDLNVFEKALGKNGVQTDDLDPYNIDFLKAYKGMNFFRPNFKHSTLWRKRSKGTPY